MILRQSDDCLLSTLVSFLIVYRVVLLGVSEVGNFLSESKQGNNSWWLLKVCCMFSLVRYYIFFSPFLGLDNFWCKRMLKF